MAQVYRCMTCEAMVAFESELKEHDGDLRQVRTFNITVRNEKLACSRCGRAHGIAYNVCCLENGKDLLDTVFKKSALRTLVFVLADSDYFYEYRRYKDPSGARDKYGPLYIEEYTYDENQPGVKCLNQLHDCCSKLGESSDPRTEVDQRNVIFAYSWKGDHGAKARAKIDSSDWPCSNKFEWYTRWDLEKMQEEVFNETYDFVLLQKLEEKDYMLWSDSNSRGTEEFMVLSWLCSGGNMLFGQWGLPIGCEEEVGSNISMEKLVEDFRGSVGDTNNQNTFADLVERGHFVGWWRRSDKFPEYVKEKMRVAMFDRHYSTWNFRKDYPHYTFTYPFRRDDAPCEVLDMTDKYTPDGKAGKMDDEEDDRSIYGLVRKRSRVLFREGFEFFKSLVRENARRK